MVRIIKNAVEIYNLDNINDICTHIEKCGRICYKSENLITKETAIPFIKGILRSGHESVIEHANVIFSMPQTIKNNKIFDHKDINGLYMSIEDNLIVISGNMRAFRDLAKKTNIHDFLTLIGNDVFVIDSTATNIFEDLKIEGIQTSRFSDLHNYITIRAICDVGAYKDLTRHRLASFSIESTRFCNYAKGKFGSELAMIKPCNIEEGTEAYNIWLECMNNIEQLYLKMAQTGVKADALRMLLPHSTKADMMMTANISEWKHIFTLRCHNAAHPSIRIIMIDALKQFYKIMPNYFEDLFNLYKK